MPISQTYQTNRLTAADLRDAFHYLYPDELPALQALVRDLPRQPLIINIGAGAGTSGLAIMESRSDVRLITIDIQDASSPLGCLVAEREALHEAGFVAQKENRYWQFCIDSLEAALAWRDHRGSDLKESMIQMDQNSSYHPPFGARPDMVFIDGDHSYEHAFLDIKYWLDILKESGVLIVHDYRKGDLAQNENGPHPMPWPGVDRAVDELLLNRHELVLRVDSLIAFRKDTLNGR